MASDGSEYQMAHIPDGSDLTEADTGLKYYWYDKRWNPEKHPLSGLLQQLLAESRKQTRLLEEIKAKGANT